MSDDIIARVHTLHKPYFDNCINACCSGEQCKNRSQLCMECGELWPCALAAWVAQEQRPARQSAALTMPSAYRAE
jgi:hypothetical protein